MPDPKEKVDQLIRSIKACNYPDMVDDAYTAFSSYLSALRDFEIVTEQQADDFFREGNTVAESTKDKLRKKRR